MRIIAFDSKKVRRKLPSAKALFGQPEFKALLGIGVTINDYKKFSEEYTKIFTDIFNEHAIQKNKIVFKSYDLMSIFSGMGVDVIKLIVEKLMPHVDFIDIFYSYFLRDFSEINKEFKVGVYWEEELEHLSAPVFIDLIEGSYPAICCYAYIQSLTNSPNQTYYIDDCPGLRPSEAIIRVIKDKNSKFLFKGDQTNFAISCADLICRYIDQRCSKEGIKFNQNLIERLELDPKKCNTTFIGPSWLNQIKPSKQIELNVNHKFPHPIFFFFVGNGGPFEKNSKDVLEKSNLFNLALNKATILEGSVKFFESADQNFITKEDFVIFHDQLSEAKIEELKKLSCPAKKIDCSYFE